MPRGERLKAPTPRAGARKLEPSRSVPDIDRFQLENRDPHGYAAKASKQAMQRVMQVTPSASARSLTASASAPQGSAVFSRADRGTIKQQPFPSPRLAYAQSPVAKEAAHAMRRPPSPALSLSSTRSGSTARSGAMPAHGLSSGGSTVAPRRVLSYAKANEQGSTGPKKKASGSSAPPTPPVTRKACAPMVLEERYGLHYEGATAARSISAITSPPSNEVEACEAIRRAATGAAQAAVAAAQAAIGNGAGSAVSPRGASGGPVDSSELEPEVVTLERADFRQLVLSLRELREQRVADQLALRSATKALSTVCRLAIEEAPASVALKLFIASLPEHVMH